MYQNFNYTKNGMHKIDVCITMIMYVKVGLKCTNNNSKKKKKDRKNGLCITNYSTVRRY